MRYHKHLPQFGKLMQAYADSLGNSSADTGIHLVENHGWRGGTTCCRYLQGEADA